ncbi:MAG: lysoplasmalogenase [Aquaticitalea sp.]
MVQLFCGSVESVSQFHYITKPAIVISLIVFFWKGRHAVSKFIRFLTVMALLFSLLGDVLLMFDEHSSTNFILGLLAFLVAHIMYILVFLKHRNPSKNANGFGIILLIYALVLFYFLKNGLGEMLMPVLVYMTVILTMSITAFLRKGKVTKISYHFVFLGAVLFMISDSILALDKFHAAIPFSSILIMLTYAMAQYFIVLGIKKAS